MSETANTALGVRQLGAFDKIGDAYAVYRQLRDALASLYEERLVPVAHYDTYRPPVVAVDLADDDVAVETHVRLHVGSRGTGKTLCGISAAGLNLRLITQR